MTCELEAIEEKDGKLSQHRKDETDTEARKDSSREFQLVGAA